MGEAGFVLGDRFSKVAKSNINAAAGNVDALLKDGNIKAFLRVIRQYESAQTDAAFQVMNGGRQFTAPPWRHPEKVFAGGKSTAAGAFQIVAPTWRMVREEMGLSDFSPLNQARAAVGLLAYRGLLKAVQEGKIHAVLRGRQAGLEWESLKSKNRGAGLEDAVKVYREWGGDVTDK